MWTYCQSSGALTNASGEIVGVGYSGHGEGRNHPAAQDQPNVGPCPRGMWTIGPAHDHPTLGPLTMDLTPAPETETYGRSAFRIHGDTPSHDASHGCLVMPHDTRLLLSQSTDSALEVVA